ncbi:MAG: 23S rRNA (guanosine(2251)-2'-O)-methyltransferase RlmB [Gammaproteobacteria bacterium]|uniref:23S rRNA (guanosine-2'-O-)-methyltransferase RlmB n=1 Tax=Candidatus Thiopontia autotrophica TaxID=2841688 RepID=A0A8J6P8F3_9GAMM|nr:23S rRNA (guanosine(2251)-2'-O)-methyltransferase RlmB [Candidatus Thiopontia autotrophica]MBL6968754.1 23S rRNA (guanosine(2251)-2'-O)-methyltransferase RlmB [Gammaproteobacteria bacterium]
MEQIFGIHAVRGWLKSGQARKGDQLLVDERRHDRRLQDLVQQAKRQGISVRKVSKREMDRLAQGGVHQGVVVEVAVKTEQKIYDDNWLEEMLDNLSEPPFLLMLDGVTDPHNLGACLRSAEAAGVHAVVVPKDRSVGITPVVRKVASGAVESLPFVMVTNLSRLLKSLADRGLWIVGATGEATDSLYEADLGGPLVLVMGAEGGGMRRLTKENCSQLVKIPMAGEVSSLNVSVASGVALFEAVRQRMLSR